MMVKVLFVSENYTLYKSKKINILALFVSVFSYTCFD